MKNSLKWIHGISLTFAGLLLLPFAWRSFLPHNRYGMMDFAYGWHMPMMYGGNGMMGFGMLFMWLISIALLVLIGLGIVWLVKAFTISK